MQVQIMNPLDDTWRLSGCCLLTGGETTPWLWPRSSSQSPNQACRFIPQPPSDDLGRLPFGPIGAAAARCREESAVVLAVCGPTGKHECGWSLSWHGPRRESGSCVWLVSLAVERRVSRCLGWSEKACIPPGTDWFAQTRLLRPVWLIDRGEERGSAEKFAMMKRDRRQRNRLQGEKKVSLKKKLMPSFPRPHPHTLTPPPPAWPWSSRSALHVHTWQVPSAAPLWSADL